MFESQLLQMPGPRDIVIYWPCPRAFSVVQKPGARHTFQCKSLWGEGRGGGRMVTIKIHTCITHPLRIGLFLYPNIILCIFLRIVYASLTHRIVFISKYHFAHSLTHHLRIPYIYAHLRKLQLA